MHSLLNIPVDAWPKVSEEYHVDGCPDVQVHNDVESVKTLSSEDLENKRTWVSSGYIVYNINNQTTESSVSNAE